MVSCVCCQCAEVDGQFKHYEQCESCGLYGHYEDEFSEATVEDTRCDTCRAQEKATA